MLHKLFSWWRNRRNFVVMDPRDNSVTFSRRLFRHIRLMSDADTQPNVFAFFIPLSACYGFAVNPDIGQPTQLADIQYNSKHKCIGFECLNPSVGKILYDYAVPRFMKPCKLTVTIHTLRDGRVYYQIEKPHEKFTRHI